jgi:hypothetical protein
MLSQAAAPDPGSLVGRVLGLPPASGSSTASNGIVRVQALGEGLGGRGEQGYFAYSEIGTNDFDLKVRVHSLDASSPLARAGLMVRENLTNSAAMAAMVVTPGSSGVQFLARTSPEGTATVSGYFPGNLPNAWLRLQRSNNVVQGFASLDGRRWTPVGHATLTLTNSLVGLAASSARTQESATAVFGDLADATGDSADPTPPPAEPPGPSSRRTALAITEIHYNPPKRLGEGEVPQQFVEVFNSDIVEKDLGGHRMESGKLRFVFPKPFLLPAGGYVVVAKNPAELRKLHPGLPENRVLGPWEGDLDRDLDVVQLWSPFGALLLEVPYTDHAPWPLTADGEGHTLVLARASWGEADPRAWSASQQPGGSPGRADPLDGDPRRALRITEIDGRRGAGLSPFLEIFNTGLDPAPLGDLRVSGPLNATGPNLPLPTGSLAAGERIAIGFPLHVTELPSLLFLRTQSGGPVWDAVTFRGSETNAPLGRSHPDQPELRPLAASTPGRPNSEFLRPQVVISEVMYQPLTGRDDDQFLEVWNPGPTTVSLAGWRLTDGVEFTFPATASLAPGARAVVARNRARLRLTYPNLPAGQVLGEFNGRLGARGERLTLLDDTGAVQFGFTYRTGGEWPSLADGGGSSLELLHPDLDPDLGSSWAASDESGRAAWQTYEVTGLLEGGTGIVSDIRVLLLDAGETLIDDVEVFAERGTNLITNPGFESGLTGWNLGGTHDRSGLATNGGFGGSNQALQLRAAGRGDNGINSARFAIRTSLRAGTNATLRIRARWLAGTRDLLLRLKGNYLELPVRLDVPEDLGTPGQPNSRSLASPRPALTELSHFPVLPAEGQPVRVTVRVSGNPGALRPILRHRIDPATGFAEPLPMNDEGVNGDRVANDGLFTAVLPGQPERTMAAFHVTLGPEGSEFRVPGPNPGREALVRWGETQPAGSLGTYRIWITRTTESRWNSRPRLHNGDLDGTFVYGGVRAIYGLGTLYSGSPFVSPGYNGPAGSTLCGYVLHFPDDDALLGERDFVMDWPIRDNTRQLEQRTYEFAAEIGLPYLHRRFVHLYVNSSRRGSVYEDTQQPGSAYLRNWAPDDNDGNLHKIEDWFEFSPGGDMEVNQDARLEDFRRSDGTKNTARYRWSFRPRSVQESAHDFSALFRLVDAAVAPAQLLEFQRDLEREMDIEEWAGVFALEHAVGNWDSFGYSRGKNMYAYRPSRGPWRLYMWDIDFVMSAGGEGPGNWGFATIDPTIGKLYQYPPFQRAYWRAVRKLVNGPMQPERFNARTEAVRLALLDNGITSAGLPAARTYVRDQRLSLLGQLEEVDRPFSVEGVPANFSTPDPVLTLQGQGPIEMTALQVNGRILPVTWFQPNRWYAILPLAAGRNTLSLAPVDATGQRLGDGTTLETTLSQPLLPDAQRLVINEIHASPKTAGAAFVELLNPSLTQSIDLSGMEFVGSTSYIFPANTFLPPNQFLVLGNSIEGFQSEFGRNQFPTALMAWTPRPEGETLAVVRPATGTNPAVTVTAVTYLNQGPWPATSPGRSLMLRDASRGEDDRVGVWGIYSPPTNASPWKEFSVTGPAGGTNLLLYVSSGPPALAPRDLAGRWVGNLSSFGFDFVAEFTRDDTGTISGRFIGGTTTADPDTPASILANVSSADDGAIRFTWTDLNGRFTGRIDASGARASGTFIFDNGTSPFTLTRQLAPGTVLVDDLKLTREGTDLNLLRNGGFESGLGTEWQLQGAHGPSSRVEAADPRSGEAPNFALRLSATAGGNGTNANAVGQAIPDITTGEILRFSGRYQNLGAQGLVMGVQGGPRFTADLRPRQGAASEATPGRRNSIAETLPPVPQVWVNEIQPANSNGPRDASGRAEPWLELHNSGSTTVALDGYFLTDDPALPGKWPFPTGIRIPAGGFLLVWLDGEPSEGTPEAPHAGFRVNPNQGVVLLSRAQGPGLQTLDYLRYSNLPDGRSYGHLPEAWVHADTPLPQPTPGLPNGSSTTPGSLWINEWMASNDGSVRDPADLDADDWFELFNPGSTAIDLAGWFLTDTSANPTKFRVPAGYRLPPGGFLLVWADEETGQNQSARPDLHVNFRLSGSGEEILLLRPDGTLADRVIFGAQTSGASQGRRPDGAPGTNYVVFASPSPGRGNASTPPPSPDILSLEQRSGSSLVLRFVARPGARYRLRTKEHLNQPEWTPSGITVTAESAVAEIAWPTDGAPHRFLQVERVP